jgi:hypothetical protein
MDHIGVVYPGPASNVRIVGVALELAGAVPQATNLGRGSGVHVGEQHLAPARGASDPGNDAESANEGSSVGATRVGGAYKPCFMESGESTSDFVPDHRNFNRK